MVGLQTKVQVTGREAASDEDGRQLLEEHLGPRRILSQWEESRLPYGNCAEPSATYQQYRTPLVHSQVSPK